MRKVIVKRSVSIPDPVRLERYRRVPEVGPAVLFFTGGTALKSVSQELTQYTKNSVHLLTPFDSGGSSAKLRESFSMPAVGDIRNRLMALADSSITGNPEVYKLASFRLPEDKKPVQLREILDSMIDGQHALIRGVPNPMRRLVRLQLEFFRDAMPEGFDLQGASIGNLILTGGYLNYQRHLDPILYLFSKLLAVQGIVRPITSQPYHLAVELEDGQRILGQHRFSGKEGPSIHGRIKDVWITESCEENKPTDAHVRNKISQLIQKADLICYPPGSFYSSVIANILPKGVGKSVAKNSAPKVYIPNLGCDPEQIGMTLEDSIKTLLKFLRADAGSRVATSRLLDFVILDSQQGQYASPICSTKLRKLGVEVIDTPLVSEKSQPYYDSRLLVQALLSMT